MNKERWRESNVSNQVINIENVGLFLPTLGGFIEVGLKVVRGCRILSSLLDDPGLTDVGTTMVFLNMIAIVLLFFSLGTGVAVLAQGNNSFCRIRTDGRHV